jgi:hypothetical protein
MSKESPAPRPEFSITVDGGEFYKFVRTLKRGYHRSQLGEVVITVCDGILRMETRQGGCVLSFCETAPPVVAYVKVGHFCSLASLVKDAKASGPLVIVFRPEFGEVALPHIGTKARFDVPT